MTEAFKNYLDKKGWSFNTSKDTGLIIFKNEDNFNCVFMTDNGEMPYVRIVVPYLITEITETDRPEILDFCNRINADTKIGKAFIFEDNLWIDAETLISDTTKTEGAFEFMLKIIKSCLKELARFLNDRKKQSDADSVISPDDKIDQ